MINFNNGILSMPRFSRWSFQTFVRIPLPCLFHALPILIYLTTTIVMTTAAPPPPTITATIIIWQVVTIVKLSLRNVGSSPLVYGMLHTLFSDILSQCSSLNVREQTPYS